MTTPVLDLSVFTALGQLQQLHLVMEGVHTSGLQPVGRACSKPTKLVLHTESVQRDISPRARHTIPGPSPALPARPDAGKQ